MNRAVLPSIREERRFPSPAIAPQALAWHEGKLWMGSRDLRRIYGIDANRVFEDSAVPGIPWAAVSTGDALRFTIGEEPEDDRYIRRYVPGAGFTANDRVACPDLTGSYLSYDGSHIYLSQWYMHRILKLDAEGNILRVIDVGAEVSGHTFAEGSIYVLRGTEQENEEWYLARVDLESGTVKDVARVPIKCRSLAFDGRSFWTCHRAGNEIVGFRVNGMTQRTGG